MAKTKIMNTENFSENYVALKKCEKIYNTLPVIYIIMGIFYIMFSFMLIISCSHEALLPIIDAIFIVPLVMWMGLKGSFSRHDLSAIGVPMAWAINCFVLYIASKNISGTIYFGGTRFNLASYCLGVNLIFLVASTVMGTINLKANIKYHYLETQVGFPHFNERAEQQRRNKIQRGIKDEFQQDYERRMRSASDSMLELMIPDIDNNEEENQ